MRKLLIPPFLLLTFITLAFLISKIEPMPENSEKNMEKDTTISLSRPEKEGETSLEEAIEKRRSVRSFSQDSLSLEAVSQILWAAQGITSKERGLRAAPSAGALYPLTIYVSVRSVERLSPGVYEYLPKEHTLKLIKEGDVTENIYESALRQEPIMEGKVTLIIVADYDITRARYGERAERYVYMEAGHVGQNIYLQAETLNIGTVAIGAFDDGGVERAAGIREEESVLYLFPLGKK